MYWENINKIQIKKKQYLDLGAHFFSQTSKFPAALKRRVQLYL